MILGANVCLLTEDGHGCDITVKPNQRPLGHPPTVGYKVCIPMTTQQGGATGIWTHGESEKLATESEESGGEYRGD